MRALCVVAVLFAVGCGSSESESPDLAVPIDMTVPLDMVVLKPECDVDTNSGCPTGQKCTVGTDNGTPRDLCFAISANPVGEGQPCMAVTSGTRSGDNCEPGLICLDFPGDGPHCRKPCLVRGECPSGSACVLNTPTSTVKTTDAGTFFLKACIADTGCDPVQQNVCSGGRNCYLSVPDDVGRAGLCLQDQAMGMAGADCDKQVACAPGFRCSGLGFCRRICYFMTPSGAPSGSGQCPSSEAPCDPLTATGIYGVCGGE